MKRQLSDEAQNENSSKKQKTETGSSSNNYIIYNLGIGLTFINFKILKLF
jgi:hypothetical protein